MFAERLKTLRKKAGLTQKQLALEVETSQQNIAFWEQGKRNPKHESLSKLANFFNVSTDFLLGNSDSKITSTDIQEAIDKSVAYDGKPITDEDREVITSFLEDYFKNK